MSQSQIAREPVSSSNIKSVGYDAQTRTLAIEFSNSRVYHYADVSPEAHQALIGADSIGRHFAAHVRNQFTSSHVS